MSSSKGNAKFATRVPKEAKNDVSLDDLLNDKIFVEDNNKNIKRNIPIAETRPQPIKPAMPNVTDKAFVFSGNVDAGKSTFIGSLISDSLDDGRGKNRQIVAKHQHEITSGKTSDISTRVLRFDHGKSVTLIDLCGHEKYFSTTASGISGMFPDYGVVVISPSRGILDMTRQHFRLLMSYNIPIFIVVTKIDVAQEASCKLVDIDITKLCKTYKKQVEFMNNYHDYHSYLRGKALAKSKEELNEDQAKDLDVFNRFEETKNLKVTDIMQGLHMGCGKQAYIPVLYISNVDGYYLDVARRVLIDVNPRDLWRTDDNANSIIKYFKNKLNVKDLTNNFEHTGSTFYIDSAFTPKGVGLVLSGINRGDIVEVNDLLLLGPVNKEFHQVRVKSMHNNDQTGISAMDHHHRGCIAIKQLDAKFDLKKNTIKRGMVLISDKSMSVNVGYRFAAAVSIFGTHSATLRLGYSPVIHAGAIRQTAKLIAGYKVENNTTKVEVDTAKVEVDTAKVEVDTAKVEGDTAKVEIDTAKIEETDTTTFMISGKGDSEIKLKAGDVAKVVFKFIQRPEYIEPNTIFIFKSGDIHGVGIVLDTLEIAKDTDPQPEPLRKKFRRMRPSNHPQIGQLNPPQIGQSNPKVEVVRI